MNEDEAKQTVQAENELKEDIYTAIKAMDPKLSEGDDAFKVAAILIASLRVGPSCGKIAFHLGYPIKFVRGCGYFFRKSKVWRGAKVYANWDDPENGGIAFWCDVNVGLGMFKRAD